MEINQYMLATASETSPSLDADYSVWLMQEYIPQIFKDSNLLAVRLYQIIRGLGDPTHPGLAEPEGGYGKYLTIYELKNVESYRAFTNGAAVQQALAEANKNWKAGEIVVKFQAQFKCRGTWAGQRKSEVGLIHITAVDIPEEADEAFNGYFYNNTVPTLIKNPNLLGVDSYQLIEGAKDSVPPFVNKHGGNYPKYYNIYRLEGPETFKVYEHSNEMATNSKNFAKFAEAWPPGTFKIIIRTQYVPLKTWAR